MTLAPSRVSACAAAKPRPRLPPVTRYTLSRNPRSMKAFWPNVVEIQTLCASPGYWGLRPERESGGRPVPAARIEAASSLQCP